jgi:uncharacterized protein
VCQADDQILKDRLARRATQQGVVSDARLELWGELRGAFVQPDEFPEAVYVQATKDPEQTMQEALGHLRVALCSSGGAWKNVSQILL